MKHVPLWFWPPYAVMCLTLLLAAGVVAFSLVFAAAWSIIALREVARRNWLRALQGAFGVACMVGVAVGS